MTDVLDCLIPRGGPSLIAAMREHARVPYVLDGDGNCHVYVDARADLDMAVAIVVNAKTSRPGVCNAAETVLVHRDVAADVPAARWPRPCPRSNCAPTTRRARSCPTPRPATEEDYEREFLDLILAVKVVDSLDEAIAHVARYGTGHSEAIVTERRRERRRVGATRGRGGGAGERVDALHRRRRAGPGRRGRASRPRSCTRAARWDCAS